MLLKKIFFSDLPTLPKCIRLYGGINISGIKFSLVTDPQNREISENVSSSKYYFPGLGHETILYYYYYYYIL